MKIEDVRTRSALTRIILSKVDPRGTKYRITNIKYFNPANLDGALVTVNKIDGKGETKVLFKKYSLYVEGELAPFVKEMRAEYIKVLRNSSPEFRQADDEFKAHLEQGIAAAKNEILDEFYENGFFKGDEIEHNKLISFDTVKSLMRKSAHGDFLPPLRDYDDRRKLIVGGVYYADLNPGMKSEGSGVRPVIILSINRNLPVVICVPLSTQVAGHENEIMVYSFKTGKKGRVCIENFKAIDRTRIRQQIGQVDARTLEKITNAIIAMLPKSENSGSKKEDNIDYFAALEEIVSEEDDPIDAIMRGDLENKPKTKKSKKFPIVVTKKKQKPRKNAPTKGQKPTENE